MPDPLLKPSATVSHPVTPVVVLVGAGGLAHAFILALFELAPPALQLRIIDYDTIELSNLNRQVLFGREDIGLPKASTLAARATDWIRRHHPLRHADTLSAVPERCDSTNALSLIQDAAVVIDATDSVETKFLLNDLCILHHIPLCYAGVSGHEGLVLLVNPGQSACLRCVFGDFSPADEAAQSATCQGMGVFGALVGLAGGVQAEQARPFLDPSRSSAARPELIRITQHPLQIRSIAAPPNRECTLGCGLIEQLDLSSEKCPLTFLYTKLALERLPARGMLSVKFGSITSAESVMRSASEEGYDVALREADGSWQVAMRKRLS